MIPDSLVIAVLKQSSAHGFRPLRKAHAVEKRSFPALAPKQASDER